ncbi:MAG: peptidase M1 [SAR86 cluster bacterium]|uniref:Peptidase M1 n=1 Tax=SAR86 cluster bacterium TaxID=2030880 RepID=A0A2A5B5L4_9GAMM|nr:MAG: peptidase M1 [SAR86 cluster bacterium]
MRTLTLLLSLLVLAACTTGYENRQDMLRNTITPDREWWDVLHYRLAVEFDPQEKFIRGSNEIRFKALKAGSTMQIDLQPPLAITKVSFGDSELIFDREGNVYFLHFESEIAAGLEGSIVIAYEGIPKESVNPPWEGGVTWGHDDLGNDFIVTTAQGIGASVWWPNKDHGYDEPDLGMQIAITVPDNLSAVSNGRLKHTEHNEDSNTKTFHWELVNPINNYGVSVNIGNYVNFSETYQGVDGPLDLDYWVLAHQKQVAENQFAEVPRMLEAFEYWFGKYPFYEDGYKLVAVSYAGMEHQSAVTYGNWFQNGYRGRDVSDTGIGMKFDFIIVHESGHEWFGNNISAIDNKHLWIHEGFTNYSENLFVEYWFGKHDSEDYVIGSRHNVLNKDPIITSGSQENSSTDMYYKAGNMLHTIRHIIGDDEKWRGILKELNQYFWHQTVTTQQVESFISTAAGFDLSAVFDQYLRASQLPILRYAINENELSYQYTEIVSGFAMPIDVTINGKEVRLTPTVEQKTLNFGAEIESFDVNRNFYIESEIKNF